MPARRPRRWPAVLAALALALAGCAGEEEAPPSTTVDTLPSRDSDAPPPTEPDDPLATTTTTSPPARVPKDVNACRLLTKRQVRRILKKDATGGARLDAIDDEREQDGDAPTTTTTVQGVGAAGSPGRLYLSTCAWPDAEDQRLRLTYVAPRSTPSALEHLTRVIETGGGFAGDARAVPLNAVDGISPAALIAPDNTVIEVAAVDGAALVYIEPPPGVAASTPEAQIMIDLVIAAIVSAPR